MSSTAFHSRLESGEQFQKELVEMLSAHSAVAAVCQNGTEHTHPQFVEKLRCLESAAAKFIRYAPDGVLLTTRGDVIHYDAKAAMSIEKDAYETYVAMQAIGCRVVLFVKHNGRVYHQSIDKVRLIPGDETVAPFDERRRFPVVDGWICPRAKRGFRQTSNMSGTPYREIDFTSMKVFRG